MPSADNIEKSTPTANFTNCAEYANTANIANIANWGTRTRSNSCPSSPVDPITAYNDTAQLDALSQNLKYTFSEEYLHQNKQLLQAILANKQGWVLLDNMLQLVPELQRTCSRTDNIADVIQQAAEKCADFLEISVSSEAIFSIRRIVPFSYAFWSSMHSNQGTETGAAPPASETAPDWMLPQQTYYANTVAFGCPVYSTGPSPLFLPYVSQQMYMASSPLSFIPQQVACFHRGTSEYGLPGFASNQPFVGDPSSLHESKVNTFSGKLPARLSGQYWGLNCIPKNGQASLFFASCSPPEVQDLLVKASQLPGSHHGKLFGVVKYTTSSYGFLTPLNDIGTTQLFFPFANITLGSSSSFNEIDSALAKDEKALKTLLAKHNTSSNSLQIRSSSSDQENPQITITSTTTICQPAIAIGDVVSFYYAYEKRGPRATCVAYIAPKMWNGLIKSAFKNES